MKKDEVETMRKYEMEIIHREYAYMRRQETTINYSGFGRLAIGQSVGFNMLSIKPANDTEEFYRAVAKFNQ